MSTSPGASRAAVIDVLSMMSQFHYHTVICRWLSSLASLVAFISDMFIVFKLTRLWYRIHVAYCELPDLHYHNLMLWKCEYEKSVACMLYCCSMVITITTLLLRNMTCDQVSAGSNFSFEDINAFTILCCNITFTVNINVPSCIYFCILFTLIVYMYW